MPGVDNDDATPVDPPAAALGRLVDHLGALVDSMRTNLPRLPFLERDARRYLAAALADQLAELGHACLDAGPALKEAYQRPATKGPP